MEIIDERLGKKEALEYLHCSLSALDDYMESGQLPYSKLAEGKSGKVLFKKSDLDKFLESKTVCPVKDITAKLAEIAVGLERPLNGRDFHAAENSALYSIYRVAMELCRDRIWLEKDTENFWLPALWKIISIIKKNFEALFYYAETFDGEPFTGAFLSKLIGRQVNFWDTLIKKHLFGNGQSALNPALLAGALPAGMGLFCKTKKPDSNHPIKLAGANFQGPADPFGNDGVIYNVTSFWKPIPAPASRTDIHAIFNHRYGIDLKIDKFVEPVTADEEQRQADATKAKKKALLEKLIDGFED